MASICMPLLVPGCPNILVIVCRVEFPGGGIRAAANALGEEGWSWLRTEVPDGPGKPGMCC